MIGRTLSHYEILAKIGEGGMGAVYKARDVRLGRIVAIKVLPPDKTADQERKRRFIQEAKAASALNHPNIVTILDIGSEDGTDFIVMEFIDGRSLDQVIPQRGMHLNDALNCAIAVADGLAKAHAGGIVHRDLKPANILIANDGTPKVLDFGLAKLVENAPANDADTRATNSGAPITEAGIVLGTVAYMSPEQAEGKSVDARSDIFSFEDVVGRRRPDACGRPSSQAKTIQASGLDKITLRAGKKALIAARGIDLQPRTQSVDVIIAFRKPNLLPLRIKTWRSLLNLASSTPRRSST